MVEASPAIVTTRTGSIAVIRFNDPAARNQLSTATLQHLERILSVLIADDKVSALIFTGTDDVFASGANIRELAQLDLSSAPEFSKLGQRVMQTIANASQVTIAAINGYCMGGALDLALACDIRVASSTAVFAHPGAKLGIITGWGGTQRLPRIIGRARALALFATAHRIDSKQALQAGLVTRVEDPVLDCAIAVCREMPSLSSSLLPL